MSWQARALNALLRVAVKRRLARIGRVSPDLVASVREKVEDTARFLPKMPAGVSSESVDAGGVPGRLVRTPAASADHALLYLHGGGYVSGSAALYREVARRLSAACRAQVLVIDYRLAPEHPFPAALDDARSALAWLRATRPATHLALAGDSAGGGLALATLLAERDAGEPLPACAVTFSAWTDLAGRGPSLRDNARSDPWLVPELLAPTAGLYLGQTPADHPLASPVYAEPGGLPPLLMHVVESEILRDDTLRFAERAQAAGVAVDTHRWRGQPHAFAAFAHLLPEARECLDESGAFVRRHWATDAAAA